MKGIGCNWIEPSNLKTLLMSDEFYSYSYGMTQTCCRKLKKATRFLCYDEMFKFRHEKRSINLECEDTLPGLSWLTNAFKPDSDSSYRSFNVNVNKVSTK